MSSNKEMMEKIEELEKEIEREKEEKMKGG